MVRRVCLVSGGTGGHLMPALVLARALRERGHEALLVTEGREVERELLRRELPDIVEENLPSVSGRFSLPWWLAKATVSARRMLRRERVDCVVSTGGRPSLPVGLAAKSLGVPLFLLEQNAVTGRVNRWLSPLAARIYHGLPAIEPLGRRALVTGTPLRPQFARVERAACRDALGLPGDGLVVLVTGGSQGARVLNETVPAALAGLTTPLHVLHLAGIGRDEEVRRRYAVSDRIVAQVRPVALDMDRMFGAADLVVCRGGGTTVAELTAAGRPAVIVPYPHHKDRQQLRNAEVLVRAGAAIVVEEKDLDLARFATLLGDLLRDRGRLEAMGAAAAGLRRSDPTGTILRDMGLSAEAAR
ncbi:MAG: UDP-N-acetylglucosamine--N-acetylmuramyl-(pentapeptide) pyrophosphoryl-undecaprenol N-acetylglucosamine transferase [Planctomycetes bacterium]|nr:UDP-N-acetylglucosamine--N-acetylmuramyl-(pentapeptide) pyrophosphoryl-undecaprenol N-acetylglucosamine transferase [Planctomycetota bacterium]